MQNLKMWYNQLLLILCFIFCTEAHKFPKDFKFGVATSAYQTEGAWNADGKSESIWDYQTHTFPERIIDLSNGDVACDSLNHIKEDVANLKKLKVHFYRFSLSWTRIMPTGFPNAISEKGISHYNKLIDALLENGIEPLVTMFHYDLPQNLQDLGGWSNPIMAEYFADYARVCFQIFGDRVKRWITINEPTTTCFFGYGLGMVAPFYKSEGIGNYLCGHNIIRGHTKAYRIYEKEFKSVQRGKVGITVEVSWWEPLTNSTADKESAESIMQLYFGSYLHPFLKAEGDYPKLIRDRIGNLSKQQGFRFSRLPEFTKEEVEDMKGAIDFIGLNHYTTANVRHHDYPISTNLSFFQDAGVKLSQDPNWASSSRDMFKVVPWGFRKLLNWIKEEYNNPEVFITENGYAGFENETINDTERIEFLNDYLKEVLNAIVEDKCKVIAYTAWSYMDNYEWMDGYTMRFGMYHVDFQDPERKRTPKMSAFIYQHIIVNRTIDKNLTLTDFMYD